jgi:hypothetical protein
MQKLTFSDKLFFAKKAVSEHAMIIGIGLTFILIGSICLFIGIKNDTQIGLIIFGAFFILFSSFFMLYTLPSSISHYYTREVIKKHGAHTNATIIDKRTEDNSFTEETNGKTKVIKIIDYLVTFEFTYNETYVNEGFIDKKEIYSKLNIGDEIPIKYLKHNPKEVFIRQRKLANELLK